MDVKLNLTNIKEVFNDFNVIFEILTKTYLRFQVNIKNLKNFPRSPL
jgi:hypothetical protein